MTFFIYLLVFVFFILVVPSLGSLVFNRRRNRLFYLLSKEYGLKLKINDYSLFKIVKGGEMIELRELEGLIKGKHVFIQDFFWNSLFGLDMKPRTSDNIFNYVPLWGRTLLGTSPNLYHITKIVVDGNIQSPPPAMITRKIKMTNGEYWPYNAVVPFLKSL